MEIPARRGFSVSYRGKTLLSRVDPVAQGERLAAEIPVKERTLYFCPSPLYGYGLSLFTARLGADIARKNSAVLCVETDSVLFEISRKALAESARGLQEGWRYLALAKISAGTEPARISGPGRADAGMDKADICSFVKKNWGQRIFRRVEVIRLGGGWQLFPELYDDFAETLRREIAVEWGNAMTLIRLGRLYSRNLIRNLPLLAGADQSALRFGSAPVMALGAGPSLDSTLDEFTALSKGNIRNPGKRNFKIVCADTCLSALRERGILPDLVVILESQHWNLRDFTGFRGGKIDAAADLSALPASLRVLGGRRFFFACFWTELGILRRLRKAGLLPETFPPLGSVGLYTAAVALRAGSGPVLTGGIDFSYTQDAYHARSTPARDDLERRQNRFRSLINARALFREGSFPARSKTGAPVRSDPAMRNYRDLFEQEFAPVSRLADISGTGLPLGVKTVTPGEAFAILNKAAPEESAAEVPRACQLSETAASKKEKISAFIKKEIAALDALEETLTGSRAPDPRRLDGLLDTADYLWAHFPECAGAGGRRPESADTGFLKRVRTEIEPFRKLWEMSLAENA